jgi:hypothetical protein
MNHYTYVILKDIQMDLEFLKFEYEMGMNKLEQMIVMSSSSNHNNYQFHKQLLLLLKL